MGIPLKSMEWHLVEILTKFLTFSDCCGNCFIRKRTLNIIPFDLFPG